MQRILSNHSRTMPRRLKVRMIVRIIMSEEEKVSTKSSKLHKGRKQKEISESKGSIQGR